MEKINESEQAPQEQGTTTTTTNLEIIKTKHQDFNTALEINDYPYGFRLRTKIRYWIKSNKKGDRFLSCTLNPKTNKWNKPKPSIYNSIMVLCKDNKGYITHRGLYPTTDRETINHFLEFIKDYDLNDFQKEQLRILKAYSKAYENVSFVIHTTKYKNKITGEIVTHVPLTKIKEYEEINEEEHNKEQEEIKQQIKRNVAYHYQKEDF